VELHLNEIDIVQLVPSLTLKLAYTPTTTTNFCTAYRPHTEMKFGMQANSDPTRKKIARRTTGGEGSYPSECEKQVRSINKK
jgi:hypothetical protein